jgi:hypothetical protein
LYLRSLGRVLGFLFKTFMTICKSFIANHIGEKISAGETAIQDDIFVTSVVVSILSIKNC